MADADYHVEPSNPAHADVTLNGTAYCRWCYTISVTKAGLHISGRTFGLDLDPKIKVITAKSTSGKGQSNDALKDNAAKDTEQTKSGTGRTIVFKKFPAANPPVKQGELCFLVEGPCRQDADCIISLEEQVASGWTGIPFNEGRESGKHDGTRKLPGPGIASSQTVPTDLIAAIARYEGLKLATLLSVTSFPAELAWHTGSASTLDTVSLDDATEAANDESPDA